MATATSTRLPPISPKKNGSSRRRKSSPPPRASSKRVATPPHTPTPAGVLRSSSRSQSARSSTGKRRVTVSPPPNVKWQKDDTETTLEDSNDLQDVLKSPIIRNSPTPCHKDEEVRRVVEVTEFHECIYSHDWTQLEKAMKKFNGKYYRRLQEKEERKREQRLLQHQIEAEKQRKEDEQSGSGSLTTPPRSPTFDSSPARGMMGILKFLPSSRFGGKDLNDSSDLIVSPLLRVDEEGRTPLHLACLHECPETILLTLLREERKATSQPDNQGQLPLHLAMVTGMHDHVLEKLIKAHPNALKTKDIQSRTPIGFAAEMARKTQEEIPKKENVEDPEKPFHWGTPIDEREKAWQFDQMKIWRKVEFLLKDLMRRKKSIIPSEHGLLVEAIEAGAPPKVINRFISTTDKYLAEDDDFAGRALAMCVERQYSLDTLQYLVDKCRDGTTMITDYTQKALVTHYRKGCQPAQPGMEAFGKEIIEWCKVNQNSGDEKKDEDGKTDKFLVDATPQCREWWWMLRFILFYAAYGKDFTKKGDEIKDKHMLHAALAVPAVQPSLIQVLLVIFPEARGELCPTYRALPVHLACTRWRYDVLRNDKDSSLEKVLKMFLKADKEQVVRRYKGRLPLHMALTAGQSWSFVKPFISLDSKSVGMRDPHTRLFPFQLAAIKISSSTLAMLLRNQYTPSEWRTTSQAEKQAEFARARDAQDRRKIGTIFELLKRHPDAINGKYLVRDSVKVTVDVKGAGLVSAHYLAWVYFRGTTGWHLNPTNVKPLRDAILSGFVPKPLAAWWDKLRELIWQTTPSRALPTTDDFLLHAALYNPDTPPTITELLLALYPMAAACPIPGTQIYPLHIAAGTAAYHPQGFEVPYSLDNMQLTLNAYKPAVRLTVNGQLPIHMCLSRGKTWKDVEALVKEDRKTLLMEDPVTKLVPFVLMATFQITSANNVLRFASIAEKQTRSIEMDTLSVQERAKVLRNVKHNFDLDVLTTIYELLKRKPAATTKRIAGGIGDRISTVSSVTADDFASKPAFRGNMATWEQHLQAVQETPFSGPKKMLSSYLELGAPRGAVSSLLSPTPQGIPSLSGFLGDSPPNGTPQRIPTHASYLNNTPSSSSGPQRPSLSSFLVLESSSGLQGRQSRNSATLILEDNYVKPDYDDDVVSSMGASAASSLALSPASKARSSYSSTTPNSSVRRMPKGQQRKSRNRLPQLPNLEADA